MIAWPVTCGWSPSSTCCATAPTTPSPTRSPRTTRRWARPDCRRCPCSRYMPGLSGDVAPVAGFDYDALHFLRRAYLLQLCGLRGHAGGRTRRGLRAVAGDVRAHGPAVAPGVALRPRGRLRPRRLPEPAVQRRTPGGRRPAGLAPGPAARAGVRWPRRIGIDPANPPAAPAPPAPADAAGGAGRAPVPYDDSPFARERHVWLGLHAAATRSLGQGSMIIFS